MSELSGSAVMRDLASDISV